MQWSKSQRQYGQQPLHLCSNFYLLTDFYLICCKSSIKFNIKKICTYVRENRCLDRTPWSASLGLVTLPWAVSGFVIMVADKILKAEMKEQLAGGMWF